VFFDTDTLCHAVTLTFDPMTLKNEQSPAKLLIILLIFAHVISRYDLDLWLLDLELLQHFGCPAVKFRTKFERNQV